MIKAAIVGLGPVAITLASRLQKSGHSFYFLARPNKRASLLQNQGIKIEGLEKRSELQEWNDCVQSEVLSLNQNILPAAEYLFLAVPHTSFLEVLEQLDLSQFTNIILLNSGLGFSQQVMNLVGHHRVLTFSNFFAAAKFYGDKVIVKAVKRKVYIGTVENELAEFVQQLLPPSLLDIEALGNCFAAEFRNITLYAHPPFSMAPVSLNWALGLEKVPKYMYKLFPEGPIERRRMKLYAQFVEDIFAIAAKLNVESFNFLHFMHHENYPVLDCFLNSEEVASYPKSDLRKKGDLLFARYCGLLVDTKSQPDEQGRYFDFSAVPVQRVEFEKDNNDIKLPRILEEDIYHLSLLQSLARRFQLPCPAIDHFLSDLDKVVSPIRVKVQTLTKMAELTSQCIAGQDV